MTTPIDAPASIIEAALHLLFRPGSVFEVRAPNCRSNGARRYTTSGYFTFDAISEAARAIADLDASGAAPGIYVTINPVQPELLGRAHCRLAAVGATTTDQQIVGRALILIDIDPVRPSGLSATDKEVASALAVTDSVAEYLRAKGWPDAARVMSGNGYHLFYAVDLPANDGGLVEQVLASLAQRFDTEQVHIDRSVANASRIAKVPGTMARKGDDFRGAEGVAARPHRRACLMNAPGTLVAVARELLESVAADLPPKPATLSPAKSPKPKRSASGEGDRREIFDHTPDGVAAYLTRHGINIKATKVREGVTYLCLDRCPVVAGCDSTSDSDIAVSVAPSGLIAYCNKHNSGTGLRWGDVRQALEPGCRDRAEGDDEGETQRDKIVALAIARYTFGRTDRDEPFAVPRAGPNVARMLRGGANSLRSELARECYKANGRAPSSSALADAMFVLEGEALAAEPQNLPIRVARHAVGIVYDLGDEAGRAVEITPSGWTVLPRSPVLFRRTALTGAMPEPLKGGALQTLEKFFNVPDPVRPLLVAWLVSTFIPDIEHPIVLLGGPQDAGKSTSGRSLGGLTDPSPAPLRSAPRNIEEWSLSMASSWVTVIDNVSGIPEWLSDAMCRAVTGDGMVRRALYTSDGLTLLVFQRPLILTSIDAGALRGDLGRRLILIDLESVTRSQKRPPRELRVAYEAARPALFGALLDVLAGVLRVLPTVQLDHHEGLADFEELVVAVDKVRGTHALTAYRAQWGRIAADVVNADAVADAIRTFSAATGDWTGTAGDLLHEITPESPPKDWPKNPTAFAGILRRTSPALAAVGVEVVLPKPTDRTRRYGLRHTALTAQPPETGAGGTAKADDGAGGSVQDNRPTSEPLPDARNGESGHLGGLGGSSQDESTRGGEDIPV